MGRHASRDADRSRAESGSGSAHPWQFTAQQNAWPKNRVVSLPARELLDAVQPNVLGVRRRPRPPQLPISPTIRSYGPLPGHPSNVPFPPFIGVSLLKMSNPVSNYPSNNLIPQYAAAGTPPISPLPPFSATDTPVLVLDPLMVSYAGQTILSPPTATYDPATIPPAPPTFSSAAWQSIQTFPYHQTYVYGAPLLPRLTLLASPLPTFQNSPPQAVQLPAWPNPWFESAWTQPRVMPFAVADRIFRSSDDVLYNAVDVNHTRPTVTEDGSGTPQYQGSYSWFVTIAPTGSEVDENSTTNLSNDPVMNPDPSALVKSSQFTVSVVVCQNRQLDLPLNQPPADVPPSEWMVPLLAPSTTPLPPGQPQGLLPGLGGGEAVLAAPVNSNQATWLAGLQPGQWLMLSGILVSAELRTDTNNNTYWWPHFRTVADWYRIVAVDDASNLQTYGTRNVTLQGPDWPQPINQQSSINFNTLQQTPIPGVQFVNLNPASNPILHGMPIYTYATVVQGVVGVFQKTITLDQGSPFTPPQ